MAGILYQVSLTYRIGGSPIAATRPRASFGGVPISPSAFELVLLIPQGLGQIKHALTESRAAGVDTHIGARQARLR